MTRIKVLTTAETDLLTLSSAVRSLPDGAVEVTARNVLRLEDPASFLASGERPDALLARLVGGRGYFPELVESLARRARRRDVPTALVAADGGSSGALRSRSTLPAKRVENIERGLAKGGVENARRVLRMLAEGVTLSPVEVPDHGVLDVGKGTGEPDGHVDAALLFYRALYLSGDLAPVRKLVQAGRKRGLRVLPIFCPGVRDRAAFREVVDGYLLDERGKARVDVVLSMLSFSASDPGSPPPRMGRLGVPWVQLIDSTRTVAEWKASRDGLRPRDRTMKITLAEFDGRLTGPPVSFREQPRFDPATGGDLRRRRSHPGRRDRALDVTENWIELARRDNGDKRVAIVLGQHPVDRGRIGSAVGLDTPASLMELLRRLEDAGFAVGTLPEGPEQLMEYLAGSASFGREDVAPRRPAGRVGFERYRSWFAGLDEDVRRAVRETWGDPSADRRSDEYGFPIPGYRAENLFVGVQPPRGYGQDREAIYHDPELAPLHSYVAFYRWVTRVFEADALVHLGKHGNLEWLPGRSTGLGEDDWPDALLEGIPLVYPFIINDPGEGAQAKRRGGAAIVDHLIAPQRRSDPVPDVEALRACLERDPPATDDELRRRARSLGILDSSRGQKGEDLRRRLRTWVDDVIDSYTRSGLHVLGRLPDDERVVDLLEALCAGEDVPRARLRRLRENPDRASAPLKTIIHDLERTPEELEHVRVALEGGFVPPGPSGAPTRGRPDLLPTGRNFYTRDLRAMPTESAWERGRRLAERLLERHRKRTGEWPKKVGIILWGTSNMRTGGEDVAQVLALLGVRPARAENGRVDGVEPIPPERLERPRVDVVVRISGFFRDAFPGLVDRLVEAVRTASRQEDAPGVPNYVARGNDGPDGPAPRVFGSRPGAYGAGLLPLIQQGNWEERGDLARTFLKWGDHAYRSGTDAHAAPGALREQLAGVEAVTQNRDNQEHDLFDSDDYFQFHGGMYAAVESLSEAPPACYFSDTSRPGDIRVRTLEEESARVFHNRVRHPVWQEGMRDHGYKGGSEMAATLDYMFGYDAATGVVRDDFYETMVEDFLEDDANRAFLEEHNPWALRSLGERFLEAHRRGLWEAPDSSLEVVRRVLRESESRREEVASG